MSFLSDFPSPVLTPISSRRAIRLAGHLLVIGLLEMEKTLQASQELLLF